MIGGMLLVKFFQDIEKLKCQRGKIQMLDHLLFREDAASKIRPIKTGREKDILKEVKKRKTKLGA